MTVPILTALAERDEPDRRVRADHAGAGCRELLHLDQRHREGEMFPTRFARWASGWPMPCQCNVRRLGRVCCARPQVRGHETTFYWYVTVMMVLAFVVSLRLPRQASYLHHDH